MLFKMLYTNITSADALVNMVTTHFIYYTSIVSYYTLYTSTTYLNTYYITEIVLVKYYYNTTPYDYHIYTTNYIVPYYMLYNSTTYNMYYSTLTSNSINVTCNHLVTCKLYYNTLTCFYRYNYLKLVCASIINTFLKDAFFLLEYIYYTMKKFTFSRFYVFIQFTFVIMLEVVSDLDFLIYVNVPIISLSTVFKKKTIKQKYAVFTNIEKRHLRANVLKLRKEKALQADFTVLKALSLKKRLLGLFKIKVSTKLKNHVLVLYTKCNYLVHSSNKVQYTVSLSKTIFFNTAVLLVNYVLNTINLLFFKKQTNLLFFNFLYVKYITFLKQSSNVLNTVTSIFFVLAIANLFFIDNIIHNIYTSLYYTTIVDRYFRMSINLFFYIDTIQKLEHLKTYTS